MNIQQIKLTFEDSRGQITDIVEQIDFNGATIISSKAEAFEVTITIKSVQYIYVLEGKMVSRSKKMREKLNEVVVKKGDLISHRKYEAHMFEAIEDTTF